MTNLGSFGGMFLCASVLLACGSSDEDTPSSGGSSIAATPLKGRIAGQPFEGLSATGTMFDSEIVVYVRDSVRGCRGELDAGSADQGTDRQLMVTAVWRDGGVETVGGWGNFRTNFLQSSTESVTATEGRIEVVSASNPGTLRVRAFADADNQVEGEITVEVCD